MAGQSVGFAFVSVDNPDQAGIVAPSWGSRFLGIGSHQRVRKLRQLLHTYGVVEVASPRLTPTAMEEVDTFARRTVASVDDLLALLYKGARLGYGVASSLIWMTGDSTPNLAEFGPLISRYLKASALIFECASTLIEHHQPRSVLTFNGRFACSKPVVESARLSGVPCLVHERGAVFDRYDVQVGSVHDLAQQRRRLLEMWTKAPPNRQEIARAFFERRRQGDGVGWRSYTASQITGAVPEQRHPKRVVYFMSSDDEYAALSDYTPHTLFASQRCAVTFIARWAECKPEVELIVRLHPALQKKPPTEQRFWTSLQGGPNVLIDLPDSETDSYALAESADMVLTYGSTVGVEAAYWGRPVILLCDTLYSGLGCVHEPQTVAELERLLDNPGLPAMPQENCLPFGYYSMMYGTPFRFYQPTSLFDGSFMGDELTPDPNYLRRLKASPIGKQVAKIRNVLKG